MAKRLITKRIGEILTERGAITQSQLETALAHQQAHGGLLGHALVALGFVSEEEIALALTAQYGFPYLPLENYEIDEAITSWIPEPLARQYCLIAIDRIGNALTLAMADPTNTQAIEAVELLSKCVVQAFVSTPTDVSKAIDKFYKRLPPQNHAPPSPSAQPKVGGQPGKRPGTSV